ncbi:MAG: tRNA threonylcarbamoyladenosine dehydratase [Zetaproteobacteria bacterium]|nr:MAG: tRNA threonylcarbamoyladenosine dehydratase [Zetaproteobacteria bacterium]
MSHAHERTAILLGEEGLAYLRARHVMIVGIGGVGGAAAEAMARAGIGRITLVDHDRVSISNMNRQLVCLHSTLGHPKVEAMGARLRDINPELALLARQQFLNREHIDELLRAEPIDYVLDCIDSVSCKAELVAGCQRLGIPVASSMGAGGRLDVTRARIATLAETHHCGLAANLRRRLRKLGASLDYPVVFSDEPPIKPLPQQPIADAPDALPRAVNGTISYLPNLFGFMLAGHVLHRMLQSAALIRR